MFSIAAPRPLDWFLLLGPVLAAAMIVALSDWTGEIFVENGPAEMLQLAVLAAATALFARASYRLGGWAGLSALGLAGLSLLFLVREAPRCDSPFHDFGPCFPSEIKTAVYFLPILLGIVLAIINPRLHPSRFGCSAFAALPRFLLKLLPLAILVPLIVVAQLADARNVPIAEELLELTAYLVLAVVGLRAAQAGDAAVPHLSTTLDSAKSDPRPLR